MDDYIKGVGGDDSFGAILIKGTENILYDTGMAYCAGKMMEHIKRELGGAPLHRVLLSHSHYDHVSGLPFLRKEWPKLKAYGSAYAAKILEKPSVRETMRRLSDEAARGAGLPAAPDYDEDGLKVDVTVQDGDVLNFGNHRITVYETPGHTRCSLSFLVDEDVLFASETIGVFTKGRYMPCYLVGYQMTAEAVKRLRNAPAKRISISHMGILADRDLEKVWDYVEEQLIKTKDEIVDIMNTYDREEDRLEAMLTKYHAGVSQYAQPDFAFLLNAAATLNVVQKECMEVPDGSDRCSG